MVTPSEAEDYLLWKMEILYEVVKGTQFKSFLRRKVFVCVCQGNEQLLNREENPSITNEGLVVRLNNPYVILVVKHVIT